MSSTDRLIVVDLSGPAGGLIRVLTLSRPRKKNALSRALLAQLTDALPTSPPSATQPIRAVLLRGEGCFSAGFDLADIDDDERARGIDPISGAAAAIADCAVPVVAAVVAHCHGGAVELVAACHVAVADVACRFSVPAVRLGIVYPAAGLRRLRARLGRAAERVLLTGAGFSADDARAWGLVHDVADDADVAARALADALVAAAPAAVVGARRALTAIDAGDDDRAVDVIRADVFAAGDVVEGVSAAKEKRPPRFAP